MYRMLGASPLRCIPNMSVHPASRTPPRAANELFGGNRRVGADVSSDFGEGFEKLVHAMGLDFQLVIDLRSLFFHHLADLARDCFRWQLEPRLRFRTVSLDRRTGIAGDLEHGGVFAQRVNE